MESFALMYLVCSSMSDLEKNVKTPTRDGSGPFFCPRVGFWVLRSFSGRVSGSQNYVRVKLGSSFFSFF